MEFLITSKPDFEKTLARETVFCQGRVLSSGRGWVHAEGAEGPGFRDLCFAQHIFKAPFPVKASSVNSLAGGLVDLFFEHLKDKQVNASWPFFFYSCREDMLRHAATVQKCWLDKLKKRASRVARFGREGFFQHNEFHQGFFVFLTGYNEARVSFEARSQGQRRMKMDPGAPSRSYLKIEESFHVLGDEPKDGESVVDLGAAPGGWSLSALKRGARVLAIDNGPLREPVSSHPHMRHLKADALKYVHSHAAPADWLFCDVLEDPELILKVLGQWLSRGWCRNFVANLKVGQCDPVAVLKRIRDPRAGLVPYCQVLLVRQLYHDREEITIMGTRTKYPLFPV
jgi:23S rRNA (cytidine2498-2'-O)-methyltransferase